MSRTPAAAQGEPAEGAGAPTTEWWSSAVASERTAECRARRRRPAWAFDVKIYQEENIEENQTRKDSKND